MFSIRNLHLECFVLSLDKSQFGYQRESYFHSDLFVYYRMRSNSCMKYLQRARYYRFIH